MIVLDVAAGDQSRLLRRLSPLISPDERATIAQCLRTDNHEVTLSVGSKTLSAPRIVLNYWSDVFAASDKLTPSDRIPPDEEIVSYDAPSEVLGFCYTGELKGGTKQEHDLYIAADYLQIPSLAIQVNPLSGKIRVHHTRRGLPGLEKTVDLRATRREDGLCLYLKIERCEFHVDHKCLHSGTYYLDGASEFRELPSSDKRLEPDPPPTHSL